MGRSGLESDIVKPDMLPRPPKDVAPNEDRGMRFIGESGDEDGEGSDSEEESVHEASVIGEDSADSVMCDEALLWPRDTSAPRCAVRNSECESVGSFTASEPMNFASTNVTDSRSSRGPVPRSNTDMNEGI
jgi:hypothetical protein